MDKISNNFYKVIITIGIAFEALGKTLKAIVDWDNQRKKEEADMKAFEKAVGTWGTQRIEKKGNK